MWYLIFGQVTFINFFLGIIEHDKELVHRNISTVFMCFLNYERSWRVISEIVCIWLSINLLVLSLKGWMTPCNLDFLLWIYLQWALSIPIFNFVMRDHCIFWRIVVLPNFNNIVCAGGMIPQVNEVEEVIITNLIGFIWCIHSRLHM